MTTKTKLKTLGGAAQEPAHKITTETGSYYVIDNGYWSKNGGELSTLMWAHCVEDRPYDGIGELSQSEQLPLQVGKSMYLGGYSLWWVSTFIVSIEEVPGRVHPDQITAHPTRPRFATA